MLRDKPASFCCGKLLVAVFVHIALQAFVLPCPAWAGGPRFVSGSGQSVQPGQAEGWNTSQLLYFTDPGDLNATVAHPQADAMVAAAAAVWNVRTSSLSLAQGGQLAEHVSSGNSYFDGSAFVFPADVQISNEASIPIAVLYDTDGSVTDLLLGSGASVPLECRQNAVTQSVDDIQTDGHIHHALLVLNGRCVGTAPEQLTQMQYQLARAFGRVLGLAWSQTNDNVFTVASPVTADQESYWPLMHPLDVLCGPYSSQCMPDPFTLRPDDLSSLATLYAIPQNNVPPGKTASGANAIWLFVDSTFPTGQGMDWLNFTATRQQGGAMEDFQVVSGVTGTYYQQSLSSPVTLAEADTAGTWNSVYEGLVYFRVVPLNGVTNVFVTSEAINPLYSAEYALGPYARPPVTPSGSAQTWVAWSALPAPDTPVGTGVTAWDGASSCSPGADGTEASPAALDPNGWQEGLLCGWGHSSWWSATVRAGRSWTLEVEATDESGAATTNKAQAVLGVWNTSDPTGTVPTVASAVVPFNSMALGVTQLQMASASVDSSFRFVVGDQYGAGRPDFTYAARLLYADSVLPATVSSSGGQITITGTGFRQGNIVQVNGVTAVVQSWSPTQIVAAAPPSALAHAIPGAPVSVSVVDAATGGNTTLTDAFTYLHAMRAVAFLSTAQYIAAGASGSWTLQLTATSDGALSAGVPVVWNADPELNLVASAARTDAQGAETAEVSATSVQAGTTATVTGCAWVTTCATWTLYGVDPSQWVVSAVSGTTQTATQNANLVPVGLLVTDAAGHPLPGAPVTVHQRVLAWEGPCATDGRCAAAPVLTSSETTLISDANGTVAVTPLDLPGIPQTVQIAASTGTYGFVTVTLVKSPTAP